MPDIAATWIWFAFSGFVILALGMDSFFTKNHYLRPHDSMRAAICWSFVWICAALIFNLLLWYYLDGVYGRTFANEKSLDFLTGYLIEKSLSIDNLFAFYLVFHHFRIPSQYQQRVFSYGIWGAIIMRLVLILAGTWLVHQFHWLLYIMGLILFLTGIRMCLVKEQTKDLTETFIIKLCKRFMHITHELHGEHFFIKKNHILYATPLFLAVIFVEMSDLIFALDSIPAIFAITTDPFIVWSSNIFAILGLRALYFVLAGMVNRFYLLKYGIALILVLVGIKMMIDPWVEIPVGYALLMIAIILTSFAWVSTIQPRRKS
jgi:TerC family integral membrane protein